MDPGSPSGKNAVGKDVQAGSQILRLPAGKTGSPRLSGLHDILGEISEGKVGTQVQDAENEAEEGLKGDVRVVSSEQAQEDQGAVSSPGAKMGRALPILWSESQLTIHGNVPASGLPNLEGLVISEIAAEYELGFL